MPLLGTKGAASAQGFGFTMALGGPFPSGYYLGAVGTSSGGGGFDATTIRLDSSNNIYVNGTYSLSASGCYSNNTTIVKLNSSLVEQFRYLYTDPNSNIAYFGFDSTNNRISLGIRTSAYNDYAYLVNVASTPTFQVSKYVNLQSTYGAAGWYSANYAHGDVDSAGNIYSINSTNRFPTCCTVAYITSIVKYNSSGTYQWARGIYDASSYVFFSNMVVNPVTGDLAVGATTGNSNGIWAFNTSGTTVWTKGFYLIGGNNQVGYITVDASGNYYVLVGQGGVLSTDSSGNFRWYAKLNSSVFYMTDCVKISGSNMYVLGTYNGEVVISKFSFTASTVTLLWSNKWVPANAAVSGGGLLNATNQLEIASDGKIWFSCQYSTGSYIYNVFGSVPADGTGTSNAKTYAFINTTWKYQSRTDSVVVTTTAPTSGSLGSWSTITPTQNTPTTSLVAAAATPVTVLKKAL